MLLNPVIFYLKKLLIEIEEDLVKIFEFPLSNNFFCVAKLSLLPVTLLVTHSKAVS